jgi:hypothetical protein
MMKLMKRTFAILSLFALAMPAWAKTHSDVFDVPCSQLWPAVKDTLRNSGKYGILGIDNSEMTASYNIGGIMSGKRTNSLVLNSKGESSCEMQVQSSFSGLVNNDEGDLKKRVTDSLAKLKGAASPAPATDAAAPAPGATPAAKP